MREEAGLTQRALGGKLRKPQSWIYNCESGNRRVDVAEYCEWAVACGVDPLAAVRRFLAASR
jgi:transcriptional regulator with XRE-family HTH domain